MSILNTLSKKELSKIKTNVYKKDSVIFHEDDKCESIGIVLEGEIIISSFLDDGNEVIYNHIHKDGLFGNNLVFSSSPLYKGNIICESDCKIAFIEKDFLIKLLKTNNEFLLNYLNIESNNSKQLNDRIRLLSMPNAIDRFYYLLHNANGKIEYDSISSLAKDLYLQRETLSRLISKLEKQKKIIKDNNSIRKV